MNIVCCSTNMSINSQVCWFVNSHYHVAGSMHSWPFSELAWTLVFSVSDVANVILYYSIIFCRFNSKQFDTECSQKVVIKTCSWLNVEQIWHDIFAILPISSWAHFKFCIASDIVNVIIYNPRFPHTVFLLCFVSSAVYLPPTEQTFPSLDVLNLHKGTQSSWRPEIRGELQGNVITANMATTKYKVRLTWKTTDILSEADLLFTSTLLCDFPFLLVSR